VVTDDLVAVNQVIALVGDGLLYQRLSREAFATWQNKPLYRDDVMAACIRLLQHPH
jgi:hypothetical protein